MSDDFDKPEVSSSSNTAIPRESDGDREGATPSNTAPSKCMEYSFQSLRYGVDSLYLSYKGELLPEAETRLAELKKDAQAEHRQHWAQVQIKDHIFEVRDKGRGAFKYLLIGTCFEIALNSAPGKMPVAYVKVASSYLAGKTPRQVYSDLYDVLNDICYLEDEGTVSRVDLFTDFCVMNSFIQDLSPREIIRTTDNMCTYRDRNEEVTGHSFGLGGNTACRIYNKTLQLKLRDGQEYLPLLWTQAGWDGEETVWRIEFQLRRLPLSELGINVIKDLEQRQEALWEYLTTKWLRIVIPDPKDKTRSRWRTHPVWQLITEAYTAEEEQHFLKRVKKDSAPDEGNIIRNLASSLASWMALRNITDVKDGLKVFLLELPALLKHHQTQKGVRLYEHIRLEIPKRIRKYKTRRNDDDLFSISNFDGLGRK